MSADIVYSVCHAKRQAVRDGLCRECYQVTQAPPDDPLPAMIAGATQRAGPWAPPACRKCGGRWDDRGAYLCCVACGATWHWTSTRVIAPPRYMPSAPGGRGR